MKRLNLLQNIKWNGGAYPLESHVSNHRQAHDAVPGPEQKTEHLIVSITCTDSTLQAAVGLVRSNTNNMRKDFEATCSSLIEVDPYRRTSRGTGRNADMCRLLISRLAVDHLELTSDDILKKNMLRSLKIKRMSSGIG